MDYLVPHFILERAVQGETRGELAAAALFADISGFTPLSETLMQHRKDGAEVLSELLNSIFAPLVAAVYAHGGFITLFAGDAFTALFPMTGAEEGAASAVAHAVQVGLFIQEFFATSGLMDTPYGQFQMRVKVALSQGPVEWGIIDAGVLKTYFFKGPAIEGCTQPTYTPLPGEVIADARLWPAIAARVAATPLPDAPGYFRLLAWKGTPVPPLPPPALPVAAVAPFIPTAVQSVALRGEFREVTSLFLSFEVGDDATMIRLVKAVLRGADQYGATFSQLDFGDKGGVMVVLFGAPVAHENDPQRAAEFLLTLQSTPDLPRWRAGMTCGTVYAGFRGGALRMEYCAIGDVMNLASRMSSRAAWGEVWLNASGADRLRATYRLKALGRFRFKGKRRALPVYGLEERFEKFSASFRGQMVGRQDELSRLRAFFAPLQAGRSAGMAAIHGAPGIGKSRLLHELRLSLQQESPDAPGVWLICYAEEILRQSLNPFKRCLYHHFGQSSECSEAENRRRFDMQLDALIHAVQVYAAAAPLARELERRRSVLAALVGLRQPDSLYERLTPDLRFENTLIALRTWLLAEATLHPLALVLEDAQWMDADSLHFLHLLLEEILHTPGEGYPLAVLAVARYNDDDSRLECTAAAQLHLDLRPLTRAEVLARVGQVLTGALAGDLEDFLSERSEGNPFFIEQLVLDLRERGAIARDELGMWRLTADPGVELPSTISAVLIARLDRLVARVRETVQTAAVLGQEFEVRVLSLMLRDVGRVSQIIHEAEVEGVWLVFDELRCLFHHALLRDAAYDMQLRSRLRQLHSLAVAAIQQIYAADLAPHYADLAYHCDRAHLIGEAAHWYGLAGEFAAAQYANTEALHYFSRALELTPPEERETRYTLLLARERLYDLLGQRAAQRSDLDALLTLVTPPADRAAWRVVMLRQASYAEMVGDYATLGALAQEVLAHSPDPVSQVAARFQWARGLRQQGELRAARDLLDQGLALVRVPAAPAELRAWEARCLQTLGAVLEKMRDYAQAREVFLQAQALYQTADLRYEVGQILNNLGMIALHQSDYWQAQSCFLQAFEVFREVGARRQEAIALGNLGRIALRQLDYVTAQSYFERVLRIRREMHDRAGECIALNSLGIVTAERGDYARSQVCFERVYELALQMGNFQRQAQTLNNLGRLFGAQGLHEKAAGYYAEALPLALRIEDRQTELEVLNNLALIAYRHADYTLAQAHCCRAIELARALVNRAELAVGLTLLGHAALASGAASAAQSAYAEAIQVRQSLEQAALGLEPLAGLALAAHLLGDQATARRYVEQLLSDLGGASQGWWSHSRCMGCCCGFCRQLEMRVLQRWRKRRGRSSMPAPPRWGQRRAAPFWKTSPFTALSKLLGSHRGDASLSRIVRE